MVDVRLFASAKAAAGGVGELALEADSLNDVIVSLGQRYGAGMSRVLTACSFLIDGVAAHGDPARVTLAEGQGVDVLPPFAGG